MDLEYIRFSELQTRQSSITRAFPIVASLIQISLHKYNARASTENKKKINQRSQVRHRFVMLLWLWLCVSVCYSNTK